MLEHRRWITIVLVLVFCGGFAALFIRARAPNEKPVQLTQLVLFDAEGLWGGNNVFVSKDGTVWVQVVTPPKAGESGLQESRYKLAIKPEKIAELEKLLNDHHFADIQIKQRPGVVDEGHPSIRITTENGSVIEKQKWSADKNADFDPIQAWLLALIPGNGSEKPVFTGPVDFNWWPEGFGK